MAIIKPNHGVAVLPPHMQRVVAEGDQLAQRLAAINAFKDTDIFKALDPLDAHLLTLQAEVMQSYLHILTIRLARAGDAQRVTGGVGNATLGKINTGKLDVN